MATNYRQSDERPDYERELGMAARLGTAPTIANMAIVGPLIDDVFAAFQPAYDRHSERERRAGRDPHLAIGDGLMWALNCGASILGALADKMEPEVQAEIWVMAHETWMSICLQEVQKLGFEVHLTASGGAQ